MNNQNISLLFFILLVILFAFIDIVSCKNVKKSIEDSRYDTGENEDDKDASLDISVESDSPTNVTCAARRANTNTNTKLVHEIRVAEPKQFPFVGAIMTHQNEYLCSGSLVAPGILLTTAKCTKEPLSHVILNTTKDRSGEGGVLLHVVKTEVFPTYYGHDSIKDVGLVYTEAHNNSIASKIRISNNVNPTSLKEVEAIGFGLNAEPGQIKELQYIGMEIRSAMDTAENLKGYFDCIETKVPSCFKDTGSPVILDNELVGIVVKGTEDCVKEMSAVYALNLKLVEILPTYTFKSWLEEKLNKKVELRSSQTLAPFPLLPPSTDTRRKMNDETVPRSFAYVTVKSTLLLFLVFYPILANM